MTRFAQRFVLEREIGAGGMARVFLGRDEVLDRPVAVKVLRAGFEESEISARFRREGRTAARLSHPNIVRVYDAGEGEFEGREVSYIVMEYVPGGDLKALIDERGPLSNAELARLGARVSSGLALAHEKGIIHRDIKPHNILIDAYGHPKLTDFGIARALDATEATRTGSYLGTALYSSPEQLRGEKITPKSDIYSLGITLYQTAAGEPPFTGPPIAVASQHVNRMPAMPSVLGARLSGEVETLILDCVQKDPDLRPTAEEIHERLQEAADDAHPTQAQAPPPVSEAPTQAGRTRAFPPEEPPAGPPPGGIRREGDRGRRRRGPVLLAAAALLLVVLGGVAAFAALGGEIGELAQRASESQQQASSSGDPSAGGEESTPAQEQTAQSNSASGKGASDVEAAVARAVEDFYASAAARDYEGSSALLTANLRQSIFPSRRVFEGTFNTLERVRFAEEPEVSVSDGTATVTGETIAEHIDRTERNRGTWTLVNVDGEWRISSWDVNNISTEYV